MITIRVFSAEFCARYVAKFAVLALLGIVTVGCAADPQQHAAADQKAGQTVTVAKADQDAADQAAKAPVPALAANSYRSTPYYFPPMGVSMPGSH